MRWKRPLGRARFRRREGGYKQVLKSHSERREPTSNNCQVALRSLRSTPAALLSLFAAGLLSWAAISQQPNLNVPTPVALIGAAAFAVAGLRIIQMILRPDSTGAGLAAVIAGLLGLIGVWISVGPGERICSTGWMLAGSQATGAQCRVPFGIGSVVALMIAIYAAREWWVDRRSRD